jgi:hypothetical protein
MKCRVRDLQERTKMNLKSTALFIVIIALSQLTGCNLTGAPDTGPTATPGPTATLGPKSFKRGLAYDQMANPRDFEAIKNGVSWYYTWGTVPNLSFDYYADYNMEFIPMLWGDPTVAMINETKAFILAHPEVKYLLVMNEPNLTDQANLTPLNAVPVWHKYEQVKVDLLISGRDIKIVGPAMNWGTMPGYGDFVVWLDAFYAAFNNAYGRDPVIDYLAFHWYDYGLASMLDKLTKYGKKVWVTEFANWHTAPDWTIDTLDKQKTCMTDMVSVCESRSDVFRYAWFYGRISAGQDPHFSSIFGANFGQLSGLGTHYLGLPYTVAAYTATPTPVNTPTPTP